MSHAYATQADLVATFGNDDVVRVADRDKDGTIDSASVDAVLLQVTNEIDGYLVGKQTLPLSPVPGAVNLAACRMAMYYLAAQTPGVSTAARREQYEDAIKWLRMVATGKIPLSVHDADGDPAQNKRPNLAAVVTADDRVFTRDKFNL